MSAPDFGYARASDGAYIAYHVAGEGPVDVVHQPEWPGNLDFEWEAPRPRDAGRRSARRPPARAGHAPGADRLPLERSGQPVGGSDPSRSRTRDRLDGTDPSLRAGAGLSLGQAWEQLDDELAPIAGWGTEAYARWFLEAEASIGNEQPDASIETINRQTRNACTPDIAESLARIWYDTDVRAVLPTVQTPTLLITHRDRPNALEATRYVADRMPNAELVELPGSDGRSTSSRRGSM